MMNRDGQHCLRFAESGHFCKAAYFVELLGYGAKATYVLVVHIMVRMSRVNCLAHSMIISAMSFRIRLVIADGRTRAVKWSHVDYQ